MADKPILFSAPMVRAILEGRKTQTRRIVRTDKYGETLKGYSPTGRLVNYYDDHRLGHEYVREGMSSWVVPVPYFPGQRLWVRETWGTCDSALDVCSPKFLHFAADEIEIGYRADGPDTHMRWRPSIHMPRWVSRITMIVTDVRVQRLQEISEEDAKAEGVLWEHLPGHFYSHISTFQTLWDSLNAKRGYGWDVNPWVCAITFQPVFKNIDVVTDAL